MVVFAVFVASTATVAEAGTIAVPADYDSLGAAVEYGAAGDTIVVSGGWDGSGEGLVTIDKELEIVGDLADRPRLPPLFVDGVTVDIRAVELDATANQAVTAYGSESTIPIALAASRATVSVDGVVFKGFAGMALYGHNADLSVTDSDFESLTGYLPLYLVADSGSHTLDVSGAGFATNDSGSVAVQQSGTGSCAVVVQDSTFSDVGSGAYNGVYLSGVTARFDNDTFQDFDPAVWPTNKISSDGTDLTLNEVEFLDASGSTTSTLIGSYGGSITLNAVSFSWPSATSSLASVLDVRQAPSMSISDVTIDGAVSDAAPIVIDGNGSTTIDRLVVANSAGRVGAISVAGSDPLAITASRFCANVSSDATYGGVIYASGTQLGVTGSIFSSNQTSLAVLNVNGGAPTVTNVDFVQNTAPEGAIHSPTSTTTWTVKNTIYSENDRAVGAAASVSLSEGYNLYWGNTEDGISSFAGTDVLADPSFVAAYDPADCDSFPLLDAGSPAMDAGVGGTDADGSAYDIGAMSGTNPLTLPDDDADGYVDAAAGGDDCDDGADGVNPGATEVPYDGIDQDCSGADLVDVDQDGVDGGAGGPDCDDTDPTIGACDSGGTDPDTGSADTDTDSGVDSASVPLDDDGDGHASAASGGDDCDDAHPQTYPGAWDDPTTDDDENCDGENATATLRGGCASVPGGGGPALPGLASALLAAFLRRRGSPVVGGRCRPQAGPP